MPRLFKGLIVAALAALPVVAWAAPKLSQGCDPAHCPESCPLAKGRLGSGTSVDERARRGLDEAMARLADGDRDAFTAVFAALRPHVRRLCERMLGRGADADDAAQQALEKVFARASTFRSGHSALPWALAIAAWECRSARSRRQRARHDGDAGLEAAPSLAPTPDEALLARELEACVREALGQLSARDRETLRATFDPDGGEPPGASGATLRKRRERALDRLRMLWRRSDGRAR